MKFFPFIFLFLFCFSLNITSQKRDVVIYNNQDKEVTLKCLYKKNDKYDSFKIPSKSFLDFKYGVSIEPQSYFELEIEGECSKVYDANKEDYIIL